jgi:choline dehydrogenase
MAKQAGKTHYDYIIAGGGTAGCVLAGRLSEDPAVSVLLLEAGRNDRHPFIHVPAGFAKLTAGPYQWGFVSAPQENCNGREIALPQGKVLGGGGSINAQVFTRGVPDDYDRWAKATGDDGWSSDGVLPYFLRSEGNTRLSGPMHGNDGPLGVSDLASPHPLSRAFVQAGQQYGLPYNSDFNAGSQLGVGYYQTTTKNGRRCSAAVAYLDPSVRRRPNLTVLTGVFADRVLLEGDRATGVEVRGHKFVSTFRADREVIVSSGAFGSPWLLQLSGIGDPEVLRNAGVEIRHALPGVGKNLQDHCDLDIVFELNDYGSMDRFNLPRPATAFAGLQYAAYRSGPLSSTVVEAGAFSFANKDEPTPDLQFHFLPASGAEAGITAVRPGFGVTLNSYFVRPRSRGSVQIRSSDPTVHPRIDPNFLDDEYDVDQSIEGVKQSREIMAQPAMAKHVKAERLAGDADLRTREDYLKFVRAYGRTSYHPVGSCAMGVSDESVVGPDLRVHGMQGLRVVDSSIMPNIVSSNTQAPTVMIAEKAVDLIRAGR